MNSPPSLSAIPDASMLVVDEYHIVPKTFSFPLSSVVIPAYGVWLHID